MNVPDKKSVMKVLIDSGKSKGQLNTKEILDALALSRNKLKKFMTIWNPRASRLSKTLTTCR